MYKSIIILIIITLQGCASISTPSNDVNFSRISKINDFVGCYKNFGETQSKDIKYYLSLKIWPTSKINHKTIKFIRVVSVSDKKLKVTAETDNHIIKESIFTDGKEFKIEDGLIVIKSKYMGGVENVFIGAGHESVVLGLDERGDGRLNQKSTFIGTGFIFIPMAVYSNHSVRFKKLTTKCKQANKAINKDKLFIGQKPANE